MDDSQWIDDLLIAFDDMGFMPTIVSHYILGVPFRKLAADMNYGERSLYRRLDSAKRKIAKGLKL